MSINPQQDVEGAPAYETPLWRHLVISTLMAVVGIALDRVVTGGNSLLSAASSGFALGIIGELIRTHTSQ